MIKSLITCDCLGTQQIDAEALSRTTGLDVRRPCSALCTTELPRAAEALTQGDTIFCCTQEARVFEALAEDLDLPAPPTLDLRDRVGWSADPASKVAKMSALVAEAMLPAAPEKTIDVISEGLCLIVGPADAALAAAEQLKDHLGVTVLLPPGSDIPDTRAFDVITGRLRRAKGALGHFEVVIDALRMIEPGGRGGFTLTEPRDGGASQCDILLDLRGDTPLFPAHEKREGYLRADPGHAPAVSAAILAASHLTGTFEKTMHVRMEPLLCAHSRAEQTGCTRCLDLCPTGAITPDGEHVSVDPLICAGCGACSAVCPSGAISYDAPPVDLTMRRVQTLAKAFLDAGGSAPRLLVHDDHGAEMIRLAARHHTGLPADVIPLELPKVGVFGHAEIVAALAAGFASVALLPGPKADMEAIGPQVSLAGAIGGATRVTVIDTPDPEVLSDTLYRAEAPAPLDTAHVRPMGTRRQITRQAARALNPVAETLPLPEGAPYGAVLVDQDACTLCLSCVSLCPSGALGDNPDRPELRFQEDACLQCGLCANVCPEEAISLQPQLDLTPAALTQRVLKEEEPFACIECGKLFGVKSTVEKITEKLQSHSMFAGDRLRMVQMCDDCRINAQYHSDENPFASKPRPRPRTTEDYLSKRRDH
ncbi:4Fe-4S binding protein [Sagittula stellata]|uniref:Iron-sulfur cluster-binding protein n=1 Tax=Sagittula stellata (strain ATCC 700073 / DSM 11524 / E-37) TaxID=388399 RepID=A3KAX3_SAGS3|nr:4Fe-4S binding protein [Sagittula stellata]EBA05701.1 iron-sulfur cluster-binding protein [Sagittula stellata E-37]